MLAGDAERLAEPARPGGEQPCVLDPAPLRISSTPSVGSSARISTAAALPSSSQTRFRHQWIPYER